MSAYTDMRDRQQQAVNDYLNKYAFFAFSDQQFERGLEKLGIPEDEAGKRLFSLGGTGGYMLKERSAGFHDLMSAADLERQQAIEDPDTGAAFAYDMFFYELNNHEFCITESTGETLDALGYTREEVQKHPVLRPALYNAARDILKAYDERQRDE